MTIFLSQFEPINASPDSRLKFNQSNIIFYFTLYILWMIMDLFNAGVSRELDSIGVGSGYKVFG